LTIYFLSIMHIPEYRQNVEFVRVELLVLAVDKISIKSIVVAVVTQPLNKF